MIIEDVTTTTFACFEFVLLIQYYQLRGNGDISCGWKIRLLKSS